MQGNAEQAQATATQAQQSAAEAQRQADQVSSSVTEAKTALALVDKQSQDENKKLSALQEALERSVSSVTFVSGAKTSSRTAPLASPAIAPVFGCASASKAN